MAALAGGACWSALGAVEVQDLSLLRAGKLDILLLLPVLPLDAGGAGGWAAQGGHQGDQRRSGEGPADGGQGWDLPQHFGSGTEGHS